MWIWFLIAGFLLYCKFYLLLAIFIAFKIYQQKAKYIFDVYYPENSLTYFGNFFDIRKLSAFNLYQWSLHHAEQAKKKGYAVSGIALFGFPSFIEVNHPEIIKYIADTDSKSYCVQPFYGVATSDDFSQTDIIIKQYFTFDVLKKNVIKYITNLNVVLLTNVLDQPCILDLQNMFERYSFDRVYATLTNVDERNMYIPVASKSFDMMLHIGGIHRIMSERFFCHPLILRLKQILDIGDEMQKRKHMRCIFTNLTNIIIKNVDIFMKNKEKEEPNVMYRIAKDESMNELNKLNVFYSTIRSAQWIACSLSWLFYIFGAYPDIADKVREETKNIDLEKCDEKTLESVKYTTAVIIELWRLYPMETQNTYYAKQDTIIPSTVKHNGNNNERPTIIQIPAGTIVRYNPMISGRLYWDHPTSFRPERWLKEEGKPPTKKYPYPIFDNSIRACLKLKALIQELKMISISLLKNYNFELSEEPILDISLLLKMKRGLRMHITRR
jgi:hypothetical protein